MKMDQFVKESKRYLQWNETYFSRSSSLHFENKLYDLSLYEVFVDDVVTTLEIEKWKDRWKYYKLRHVFRKISNYDMSFGKFEISLSIDKIFQITS